MPIERGVFVLVGIILAGIILAGIAALLVCRVTTGSAPSWLLGMLVVVQASALARMAVKRLTVLCGVSVGAAALVVVLVLGPTARSAALTVAGVCHAAAYSGLLIWFSRSLLADREPLVTRFARQMRQTMPAEVVRYTRRVTLLWSVFFAAQLGISAGLLALAPEAVWSSFVTGLNLPLTMTMMLAEFACRSLLFHHDDRTGLLATFQGLRRIRGGS